ncbi:MAG: hypothetical protein JXN61_14215 [Sedimentisphaerales bacterium]|nr:hypothetical protein [Sedimentisphaerales bacterium]
MRIPLSKWQMLWLGVVVVSAGCTCDPRIDVRAVGYENRRLRVDLVGVNPEEKARWRWDTVRMRDYWKSISDVRTAAEQGRYQKIIEFRDNPNVSTAKMDNGGTMLRTVEKDDSIWQTWKQLGAVDLYVLILPYEDTNNPTPRPVSLDYKKCWKKCTLEITIDSGEISVAGDKCSN